MKWFNKWFNKKVREAWENARDTVCNDMPVSINSKAGNKVRANYEDDGAINFRIISANGGKIVEAMSYDSRLGREKTNIYIIADGDDFNSSLSKIVTLEYIR